MGPAHFHPLSRNRPKGIFEVKLRPRRPSELSSPYTSENQQTGSNFYHVMPWARLEASNQIWDFRDRKEGVVP
ncbi:hypothetical protein PMI38_01357 [Pseudomonas sp. GM84]|nr:hypothetical protein PMI38_01357 [Pseudomonas sp. GM84]